MCSSDLLKNYTEMSMRDEEGSRMTQMFENSLSRVDSVYEMTKRILVPIGE